MLVGVVFAIGLATPGLFAQTPPPPAPSVPEATPISVEDRFRRLEQRYDEMERRHAEEYRALSEKYQAIQATVNPPASNAGTAPAGSAAGESASSAPTARRADGFGAQGTAGRTSNRESSDARAFTPRERGGTGAQGTDARTFVRENTADAKPLKRPAKVLFSEGLEFASEDDEFQLTFHNLTQAEYRGFPAQDRGMLQNQFFIPRQRWYFTGQATKSVEFYTVINRGYGSLDLLDAFITLNLLESLTPPAETDGTGAQGTDGRVTSSKGKGSDNRFRFRVGRMKTPYLYEYFSIAEGDLIAPERSLLAGNLSGNRQDGMMALGELFGGRIGYSTGIFNGPRRSFQDFNSSPDGFLYLNSRPFLKSETLDFLRYLNIGGTAYGGVENNPAQPNVYRTANDQTTSSSASALSPTFLALNSNVTERGMRSQWSGHVAYFYKSLMLLGELGGGTQGYSTNGRTSTQVPFEGYMVQAAYFLTGEQLTRRVNVVRPRRNFGYNKGGEFGFGAVEVHARYSQLGLGRQIFTGGFADPNQWTNNAYAIDTGVNWYLNYYTKVYFDWQHAGFANPVVTGNPSHRYTSATDLFWLRFQLFF